MKVIIYTKKIILNYTCPLFCTVLRSSGSIDSENVLEDATPVNVVSSLKTKHIEFGIRPQVEDTLSKRSLNTELHVPAVPCTDAARFIEVSQEGHLPDPRSRKCSFVPENCRGNETSTTEQGHTCLLDKQPNTPLLQQVLHRDINRTYYAAMKKANGIVVRMGDVVSVWTNSSTPDEVSHCQIVALWRMKSDAACFVAGRWFESYESLQPYLTKSLKK